MCRFKPVWRVSIVPYDTGRNGYGYQYREPWGVSSTTTRYAELGTVLGILTLIGCLGPVLRLWTLLLSNYPFVEEINDFGDTVQFVCMSLVCLFPIKIAYSNSIRLAPSEHAISLFLVNYYSRFELSNHIKYEPSITYISSSCLWNMWRWSLSSIYLICYYVSEKVFTKSCISGGSCNNCDICIGLMSCSVLHNLMQLIMICLPCICQK